MDEAQRRVSVGAALAWLTHLREAIEHKDWSTVEAVVETMEHEIDIRLTAPRSEEKP